MAVLVGTLAACSSGPGVDDVVPPSTTVPADARNQILTDVTEGPAANDSTDSSIAPNE